MDGFVEIVAAFFDGHGLAACDAGLEGATFVVGAMFVGMGAVVVQVGFDARDLMLNMLECGVHVIVYGLRERFAGVDIGGVDLD